MKRLLLLAACGLLSVGCDTSYSRLKLRPVDTTSQLTVSDVRVAVDGKEAGTTDDRGLAEVSNLRWGDTITLTKPGYEPVRLKLGFGQYRQWSPAGDRSSENFSLNDLDSIPVPMHRAGQVRRGR